MAGFALSTEDETGNDRPTREIDNQRTVWNLHVASGRNRCDPPS
jgi:hypothetical protein